MPLPASKTTSVIQTRLPERTLHNLAHHRGIIDDQGFELHSCPGSSATAVLQLLYLESTSDEWLFFLKKKPPRTGLARARELENRSKVSIGNAGQSMSGAHNAARPTPNRKPQSNLNAKRSSRLHPWSSRARASVRFAARRHMRSHRQSCTLTSREATGPRLLDGSGKRARQGLLRDSFYQLHRGKLRAQHCVRAPGQTATRQPTRFPP